MNFFSLVFVFFLALVLLGLYAESRLFHANQVKAEKLTLLIASCLFVAYAHPGFAVLLALEALLAWLCARNTRQVPLGITAMLLLLGLFKYSNFFIGSLAPLFGVREIPVLPAILPLGLSFYTFSAIGYLVDVKRGQEQARSFADTALYLSFFPKLTSGPIQRSQDFFTQINRPRSISCQTICIGMQVFLFGLFKKLVLANHLSLFVSQVYQAPLAFSSGTVLLAVLSYSFQIYFDFSGYSDMAIGVAKMIDIDLPRNFNLPYLAHNVTEFWKRWHITLSSWLQSYLYFPLGGNRKGWLRTYANLILTMMLGGLWHGASWTYIVWGLLHGLGLVVHKLWVKKRRSSMTPHSRLSNAISAAITFLFVSFCWIFFRADSLSDAFIIIGQMCSFRAGVSHLYVWSFVAPGILLISSCLAARKSFPTNKSAGQYNQCYISGYYPVADLTTFSGLLYFFVFLGLILLLACVDGSPFIYGAY